MCRFVVVNDHDGFIVVMVVCLVVAVTDWVAFSDSAIMIGDWSAITLIIVGNSWIATVGGTNANDWDAIIVIVDDWDAIIVAINADWIAIIIDIVVCICSSQYAFSAHKNYRCFKEHVIVGHNL